MPRARHQEVNDKSWTMRMSCEGEGQRFRVQPRLSLPRPTGWSSRDRHQSARRSATPMCFARTSPARTRALRAGLVEPVAVPLHAHDRQHRVFRHLVSHLHGDQPRHRHAARQVRQRQNVVHAHAGRGDSLKFFSFGRTPAAPRAITTQSAASQPGAPGQIANPSAENTSSDALRQTSGNGSCGMSTMAIAFLCLPGHGAVLWLDNSATPREPSKVGAHTSSRWCWRNL